MAQIILNIPDAIAVRVLNAFCDNLGYNGVNEDGAPESKQQFAKRMLIKFIKDNVRSRETLNAAATASLSAQQDVDANINLS